tara:strand:- start:438 stop:950 length:513 start_codon:yes stop_codon:yes gene_type:complete
LRKTERYAFKAREEDLETIIALHDRNFGQPDEGLIVRRLHENDESLLSVVAQLDHKIVGHCQFFDIETGAQSTGFAKFAGLGPISVLEDHRNIGMGYYMISYGLRTLKRQGYQKVFVLGDPAYYSKDGFSVDETAGMSAPWGGPYFLAKRLNPGGPELAELIYPSAFFED